ncbi:hypothetical protein HGRIS_000704 [Hohenbuehelia grisea]|uniref:Uncharacterized protein n=1 Tax=Hohenbuehelia grisea TaxID=104357 RepID=A0ABR3JRS9_9AGAR
MPDVLLKRVLTPTDPNGVKLHPSVVKDKTECLHTRGAAVRNTGRPDLAVYQPLPDGWHTRESYLFYGWAISDDMLHIMLGESPETGIKGDLHFRALQYLRFRTGFKHFMFVNGKVDANTPSDRVVQLESTQALRIFAVSCSKNKRLFMRRPLKAQMKCMVNLFGEEPRWYEDLHLKREFSTYEISY